jgi:hypothetical protein
MTDPYCVRVSLSSRSDTIFESKTSNLHGLDAETRLFFLQVYERHPDLNIAEKRLLARSARVGIEVVDSFCKSTVQLPHFTRICQLRYILLRIPRGLGSDNAYS